MKNGLHKIAKGIFAIFTIKLVVFGVAFIIQSCESDNLNDSSEVITAKQNFKKSTLVGLQNLNKVDITNPHALGVNSFRYEDGIAKIEVFKKDGLSSDVTPTIGVPYQLLDLINIENTDLGVKYIDGSKSNNIDANQEFLEYFEVSIADIKTSLQPTLTEAKNYLYANGLTDNDIEYLLAADEEGPAMSESDLIPVVMQLIAEEQNMNTTNNLNYMSLFGSSANASEIGDCIGDALGISAIAAAIQQGIASEAGKALLKKALRKVATRALGWVGAAIFVYEFGDCMEWW